MRALLLVFLVGCGSAVSYDPGGTPTVPVCAVAGAEYDCTNLSNGETLSFAGVDGGPDAFSCTPGSAAEGAACTPGAACAVANSVDLLSGVCQMR